MMDGKGSPKATNNGLLNQAYSFVFLKILKKAQKQKKKGLTQG